MTTPNRSPDSGKGESPTELADIVAAAVLDVPGVADLHAGMFGEVGTYLPGRRVPGIRIGKDGTAVHVTLTFGTPVRTTAAHIRDVVAAIVGDAVDVIVEDVVAATGAVEPGGTADTRPHSDSPGASPR